MSAVLNAAQIVRDVIVLGASAGGFRPLMELFAGLTVDLPATVALVIHRSPLHEGKLSAVLGRRSLLPVIEPRDGQRLEQGTIYVAPRDRHLLIDGHRLRLTGGPKEHFTRPAVDPLFTSAAASVGARAVGVVLSGTGDDGVSGLIRIKAAGGLSLVQYPGEAAYATMPKNALMGDTVDAALRINELIEALPRLARGEPFTLQVSAPRRPARPA